MDRTKGILYGVIGVMLLLLVMPLLMSLMTNADSSVLISKLAQRGYDAWRVAAGDTIFTGDLIPNANNSYDVGANLTRWKDGYYAGNLYAGTVTNAGLTNGRVVLAGAGGLLGDDADLTFSGSRLTVTDLTVTNAPTAPTGRGATLVVAANNATATEKAQADYVCDGINDHLEIQAAIDALTGSRTVKEAVKCIGSFSIAASVTITSYTILDLYDAKVTLADGSDCIMFKNLNTGGSGNTDIDIFGGILDGNASNQTIGSTTGFHCIQFTKVTRGTVKFVTAVDSTGYGIGATGSCDQIDFSFNNCSGHFNAGIMFNNGTTNFTAIGNNCSNNPGNGVDDGDGIEVRDSSTDGIIADNICDDNNEDGIETIDDCVRLVIKGNHCVGNGSVGISGLKEPGNALADSIISDNVIGDSGTQGISLSATADGVLIQNNRVYGSDSHGIAVTSSANVEIVGNHVSDTLNTAAVNGIYLSDCQGCLIDGNIAETNSRSGIYLYQSRYCTVTGNVARNNSQKSDTADDGIRLNSDSGTDLCAYNVITGNSCYDDQGSPTQAYGITEIGTNCAYNVINSNTCWGNVIAPVRVLSSSSRAAGNTGYIASGEIKTACGSLTAGNANAIAFAWHDPELQDIYIKKVIISITTPGGTAGSLLDVGIADNATGTNRGTEFFNDLLLENISVNDSWVAGDGGTQTKWVLCQDSASATDGWVVGQILDANAASLVGKYYIEYVGK